MIEITLTDRQLDFLDAIMNNIIDVTEDESVRRDARNILKKTEEPCLEF